MSKYVVNMEHTLFLWFSLYKPGTVAPSTGGLRIFTTQTTETHHVRLYVSDLPEGQSAHIEVPEHPGVQDGQEAGHPGPPLPRQAMHPSATHR